MGASRDAGAEKGVLKGNYNVIVVEGGIMKGSDDGCSPGEHCGYLGSGTGLPCGIMGTGTDRSWSGGHPCRYLDSGKGY